MLRASPESIYLIWSVYLILQQPYEFANGPWFRIQISWGQMYFHLRNFPILEKYCGTYTAILGNIMGFGAAPSKQAYWYFCTIGLTKTIETFMSILPQNSWKSSRFLSFGDFRAFELHHYPQFLEEETGDLAPESVVLVVWSCCLVMMRDYYIVYFQYHWNVCNYIQCS